MIGHMPRLRGNATHEWLVVGDVLVTCSRDGVIDDANWANYMEFLNSSAKFRINLSLTSSKASITAIQRKAASDVLKARNVTAIVLTDSALARGIVTALTWLGTNVRAYSYADVPQAIRALEVSDDVGKEITAVVQEFIAANPTK